MFWKDETRTTTSSKLSHNYYLYYLDISHKKSIIEYMPALKKTTASRAPKSKSQPVKAKRVNTQQAHVDEISYETKLTIVILLLLFVYPLGLVFMWVWMKNWPLWLRLLISLPLALGVIGIFFGIFAISLILRHIATDKNFQYQMHEYQKQYQQYQLSPVPSEEVTPTQEANPTTDNNGGTY